MLSVKKRASETVEIDKKGRSNWRIISETWNVLDKKKCVCNWYSAIHFICSKLSRKAS